MLLHHYTAREYLPSIARHGLRDGEVAVTPHHVLNAVWLTNDANLAGHGLTDGREPTAAERRLVGLARDEKVRFPNKRAIRMDVIVPRGDKNLVRWSKWAVKRVPRAWYDALDAEGQGKSKSWFLYWGIVPVAWIRQVHDLGSGRELRGWRIGETDDEAHDFRREVAAIDATP